MTGTIHLGGGGSADDGGRAWRGLLEGKDRLILWPFALPARQRRASGEQLAASLRRLGSDVAVDTWTDLADHTADDLRGAHLLFVAGGNTFELLAHVREHGFGPAVHAFVAAGGDYVGSSAGALLAGEDIGLATPYDENAVGLTDLTALALVPGVEVLPHYVPAQADAALEWAAARGRVVLGIPEGSGVAVRDGVARVVGVAPVGVLGPDGAAVRDPGDSWTLDA
ncbi:MAG TPA: Type 1 glutamine amidotransferase-like domain-containing protein [Kineosporiaceae bacterium]|jgi:dipeptidase E|nr:Type 1 glutamine amidotransferase-like domain-containing protein [Kineosporiaceae bacterium]